MFWLKLIHFFIGHDWHPYYKWFEVDTPEYFADFEIFFCPCGKIKCKRHVSLVK